MVSIPQTVTASSGRLRYQIVLMIFAVTVVNYADRAIVSIVGAPLSKELAISPVALGYIFSAFGWSYVAAQIPGGWLLDRYGSKRVYGLSILLWSIFTFAQGSVGFFGGGAAIAWLFVLRFLVGAAESPSFPGNARIVAAWFPTAERGKASAIFNAAQYFAPVLFAPLVSWITQRFGWSYSFFVMGLVGIALWVVWGRVIHGPREHPAISEAERTYIERGGALMQMDGAAVDTSQHRPFAWSDLRQLLGNRMLLGVYIAQHCITAITYFFLTWFPLYLIKDRGMSILNAGLVAVRQPDQIAGAAGQPPDLAIRADVDVPDRKLKMTLTIRRNNDASLPASHTAELTFTLPPDFNGGGVANVPGVLMKSNEQTKGVPLAGLAVKVTDGFFLVGLSNVDADKTRNIQLLKERSWFDIPLVYTNQRRAILAVEKGAPGERAFNEAFAAWGQ